MSAVARGAPSLSRQHRQLKLPGLFTMPAVWLAGTKSSLKYKHKVLCDAMKDRFERSTGKVGQSRDIGASQSVVRWGDVLFSASNRSMKACNDF